MGQQVATIGAPHTPSPPMSAPKRGNLIKVVCVAETPPPSHKIDAPETIARWWRDTVEPQPIFDPEKEHLVVIGLNTRYLLKSWSIVSIGSINESLANPREIFRPLVVDAAFAFILMHNHPSGDPSPSESDRRMATRIRDAAAIMRINMLDFVIIGKPGHFSFKDHGLI